VILAPEQFYDFMFFMTVKISWPLLASRLHKHILPAAKYSLRMPRLYARESTLLF
jgi:hypothetical protein